ncbi:MAG: imidazolonepropionase [Ilumatobacteraceae bacterium]|nr:imidazolonepropionase [Ilumatobacteraceae bacterium]
MTTTVYDNIGRLVTNDVTLGDGPLGIVRDASLVTDGSSVLSIGPAGQTADHQVDVEGRAVIPGFVDSHSHLVFAGDRSEEFASRMGGASYAAGGIRDTVAATAAASDDDLRRIVASRRDEALRAGITSIEIKSGYGLTAAAEARSLRLAHELTGDTTFLGAHVVPHEFVGRTDDYVALVCGAMLTAAIAERPRFVDVFCEVGAFDADQSRAVLRAGIAAGLIPKIHANQLGQGPGVAVAVEMGCASADHCTHLSDADVEALAGSRTVATVLPAADFSTRQPYADARRLLDAGATVALATNCNPGSSNTTSMSFCIALAVRDMGMTADEALQAATLGGAAALRRDDVGRLSIGGPADFVVLDAPSHLHLIYRPGVPLIHMTHRARRSADD